MEAKELRLGNLVYLVSRKGVVHLPETTPFKVLMIGEFNCSVLHYGLTPATVTSDSYSIAPYSDLSPIPITAEWLLKFEFEKNGRHYTTGSVGGDMSFCISAGSSFYWCNWESQWGDTDWNSKVEVTYVHQLQNLYFALTGEELTVKETASH